MNARQVIEQSEAGKSLRSLIPLFDIFLDPTVGDPRDPLRLAKNADENDLDLLTVQDHPYQPRLFETLTLLTALATQRIHATPNVANLPLSLYG